jgi:hypothetical protein
VGQSGADTVAATADLLVLGEGFESPVIAVLVPDAFDHVIRWEPLGVEQFARGQHPHTDIQHHVFGALDGDGDKLATLPEALAA